MWKDSFLLSLMCFGSGQPQEVRYMFVVGMYVLSGMPLSAFSKRSKMVRARMFLFWATVVMEGECCDASATSS